MVKKVTALIILFAMLLHPMFIHAEGFKYAEIFDPKQDKVVKAVKMNAKIYNLAAGWIKDIDGIYSKFDPVKDEGYAVRIPLDPAVKAHGRWLNADVNEIYIIIPENDPPFFMIFESEDKLTCFPFTGSIDELSKELGFKLRSN